MGWCDCQGVELPLGAEGRIDPVAEDNFAIKWACINLNGHARVVELLLTTEGCGITPCCDAQWRCTCTVTNLTLR